MTHFKQSYVTQKWDYIGVVMDLILYFSVWIISEGYLPYPPTAVFWTFSV